MINNYRGAPARDELNAQCCHARHPTMVPRSLRTRGRTAILECLMCRLTGSAVAVPAQARRGRPPR